ncbi:3384_t:CDS:1, partial [Paraglomus brasilianum]
IPQDNPPTNNSTDIPIFNILEIVSPQPEKETSENIVESAKIIEASDNRSSDILTRMGG